MSYLDPCSLQHTVQNPVSKLPFNLLFQSIVIWWWITLYS